MNTYIVCINYHVFGYPDRESNILVNATCQSDAIKEAIVVFKEYRRDFPSDHKINSMLAREVTPPCMISSYTKLR